MTSVSSEDDSVTSLCRHTGYALVISRPSDDPDQADLLLLLYVRDVHTGGECYAMLDQQHGDTVNLGLVVDLMRWGHELLEVTVKFCRVEQFTDLKFLHVVKYETLPSVKCLPCATAVGPQMLIGIPVGELEMLSVSCDLDGASQVMTTVSWVQEPETMQPDQWQITVINNTMSQSGSEPYHQWIFDVDRGIRCFQVPLRLRPGHSYQVVVRGLVWKHQTVQVGPPVCSFIDHSTVLCRGTAELRAGPVLTPNEVSQLYITAIRHASDYTTCEWFYRNKPRQYFDQFLKYGDGIMKRYIKDANGDQRCPINGEICGLFFLANSDLKKGGPMARSPFGDTRLLIRPAELFRHLNITNVYFADFFCMKQGGPHYVTLVLTTTGSEADRMCSRRLKRMDMHTRNGFLYWENDRLLVSSSIFVELFVTEDINVKHLLGLRCQDMCHIARDIPSTGEGSKPGGIPKTRNCSICDIFADRPMCNPSRRYFYPF